MKRPSPPNSVRPNPASFVKGIREIAARSENVAFGTHARERMEERGITDWEAIRVLRTGELKGDIEPGTNEGEWKCKFVAPIKGSRKVGVVTILLINGRLFVKTVEWEDL